MRRDRAAASRQCSVDELGRLGFLGPALGADMEFYILMLANLIGAASLAGWLVAWAKLDGRIKKAWRFRGQRFCNALILLVALAIGSYIVVAQGEAGYGLIGLFFVAALAFGVMVTLPTGGTDMPAVISLFNAFTGLAVGLEGFVLQNPAIMIAGMVLGSAGTVLTLLLARAMSVTAVIVPKHPRHARGGRLVRQPQGEQPV
jgi:NAD(P) transhydrogenase subunit beta